MRKRLSLILLLTLTLLLAALEYRPAHVKLSHLSARPGPIVFFGDSLTTGVGALREGFVDALQRRTGQPLINRGRPGDTTESALTRLQSDVLALHPALVMVELGGNDYLNNVDPDVTFAHLREIVTRIQAQGAGVVLLAIDGGPLALRYRQGFRALSESLGTGLVPDILDGVMSRPDRMSDAIHPNDAGYQIVADNVEADLRYCLKELKK